MRSRCDDEQWYVERGRSLDTNDVFAHREQVIDVRSGGLGENDRDCRTVVVRSTHIRFEGRQLHVNLMRVCSRAVIMVIAVGIALVYVQQGRFGIEAEECCT